MKLAHDNCVKFPSLEEVESRHLRAANLASEYIRKNFTKKISIGEIAKIVFVSKFHFSRIFKKHTLFSPYQYLLHIRLQHAGKLIHQKELPIKEISFQSGFNSIDYFSAAFTKKYKMCPTAYRKIISRSEMGPSLIL